MRPQVDGSSQALGLVRPETITVLSSINVDTVCIVECGFSLILHNNCKCKAAQHGPHDTWHHTGLYAGQQDTQMGRRMHRRTMRFCSTFTRAWLALWQYFQISQCNAHVAAHARRGLLIEPVPYALAGSLLTRGCC